MASDDASEDVDEDQDQESPEEELTEEQRIRNAAILCCACLRNLAFYKNGWQEGKFLINTEFWRRVNGNFIDTAVHDWYKLFADHKFGKHFWRRLVQQDQQETFKVGLIAHNGMTADTFAEAVKRAETYRDKFLAHLDDQPTMHIPTTEFMRLSVEYLLDFLLHADSSKHFLEGTGIVLAADITASAMQDGRSEYLHRLTNPPQSEQ